MLQLYDSLHTVQWLRSGLVCAQRNPWLGMGKHHGLALNTCSGRHKYG